MLTFLCFFITIIKEYSNFIENTLGKEIYGVSFSWDDYEKFKKIIDMEYMNFKIGQ